MRWCVLWLATVVATAGCAISLEPAPEDGAARTDAAGTDVHRVDTSLDLPDGFMPPMDAIVADVGAPVDVVRHDDVQFQPESPNLFGCNTDSDCGGATGTVCLTQWPGGLCTRQCSTDRTCGPNGICFQNICLPRCTPTQYGSDGTITTPGGSECVGRGEVCYGFDMLDSTRGACFPSCNVPMDPGVASCPNNTSCDLYTGSCESTPFMYPGPGDVGTPCTAGADGSTADCRSGLCIPTRSGTMSSGFVDGYCAARGIQLDLSAYVQGQPLPRSNCPTGSVVLPSDPMHAQPGDAAYCFLSCTTDAQCRAGYQCFTFDGFFSTGACLPINCGDATHASLPNGGCPANSMCATTNGNGVCAQ